MTKAEQLCKIVRMQSFSVLLTNSQKEIFELKYALNETAASLLWFESLKKAKSNSRISETRLYGFPGPENSLDHSLEQLNKSILALQTEFPEILDTPIDNSSPNSLQESLSLIHRNFVHNHNIEKRINTQNHEHWHSLNAQIHKIESHLIILRYPSEKIHRAQIQFAWQEPYPVQIPKSCFNEFSFISNYGDLNIVYTEVGRHLLELYYAQDEEVLIKHIMPYTLLSANAGINLGPPVDARLEKNTLKKIEVWFKKNEAKFNSAGIYWDRPERALGTIRVARLIDGPETIEQMEVLQNQLFKFDSVSEIIINNNF